MAQPAGPSGGGGNTLGITGFWPTIYSEPPMLCEFWYTRFQWVMVAKHRINPKNFYFDGLLTEAQITAWVEEVDGKNRMICKQFLVSNLYLCLGEKGQEEFHKRRPHMNLGATHYPRVVDALEAEFKKERNETYETFQLLSPKHQIN